MPERFRFRNWRFICPGLSTWSPGGKFVVLNQQVHSISLLIPTRGGRVNLLNRPFVYGHPSF